MPKANWRLIRPSDSTPNRRHIERSYERAGAERERWARTRSTDRRAASRPRLGRDKEKATSMPSVTVAKRPRR